MKQHRTASVAWSLAASVLLCAGAPAVAAERVYDAEVGKMIDSARRGLDRFVGAMSGKAKGAKVTRDGVETDISDFLEDFKTDGKRMDEKFSEGGDAEQNVLGFLQKAKATDGFLDRHPGFTGAETEWAAMLPTTMSLASAYGVDWSGDPAGWSASRVRDAEIASLLKGLDTQAKGLDKALTAAGKAAKVDKAALKGLSSQVKSLAAASSTFSKSFSSKKPVGGAARSCAVCGGSSPRAPLGFASLRAAALERTRSARSSSWERRRLRRPARLRRASPCSDSFAAAPRSICA